MKRSKSFRLAAASLAIVVVAVAALRVMGRTWWCKCATPHVFVTIEGVMLLWIRDSLLLNVLMLLYPIEAIKQWQMGG